MCAPERCIQWKRIVHDASDRSDCRRGFVRKNFLMRDKDGPRLAQGPRNEMERNADRVEAIGLQ